MAATNWIGGTTGVAQVTTGTVAGSWVNGNTITTTLTNEGGGTQSVVTTATGSNISTAVIDPHIIDLNNSTETLFEVVTWDKLGSTEVRGTADIAGVPFYMSGSVTGSGTYGSFADDTANAGANDVNTVGNWESSSGGSGSIPTSTGDTTRILAHPDDIDINGQPISYDIKYGLRNTNSVSFTEWRLTQGYRGIIGDPEKSYFWAFDCIEGTAKTILESNSPSVWIKGAHDLVQVLRLPAGENALRMTTGTIVILNVIGSAVRGKMTIANVVTTVDIVQASNNIKFGASGTPITDLNVEGGGLIEIDRGVTNADLSQCTVVVTGADAWGSTGTHRTNNRGAHIFYNGTGLIFQLNNRAGTFDFRQNSTFGVTVTNATIWSGLIADRSGGAPVTYSNPVKIYGGDIQSATAVANYQN